MKANRFLTLMAMLLLAVVTAFAQAKDEVTLTVSGDGATKEEATKVALRSAIEQAYGTFVSANTQILNDELVKDEIVTISSGNVKNYQQLSHYSSNGKEYVTLQATVCISKLVAYAQSKGASTEFAGASFAMNLKIKELNKKNEAKALGNLLVMLGRVLPSCYDLKYEMSEPFVFEYDKNYIGIRFDIHQIPNKNAAILDSALHKTLKEISLSKQEQDYYKTSNLSMWSVSNRWFFRNSPSVIDYFFNLLVEYASLIKYNFVITDNLGKHSYLTPIWHYDFGNGGNFSLEQYCQDDNAKLRWTNGQTGYTLENKGKCHYLNNEEVESGANYMERNKFHSFTYWRLENTIKSLSTDLLRWWHMGYYTPEKGELSYKIDWDRDHLLGIFKDRDFLSEGITTSCYLLINKNEINKYTNFEVTKLGTDFSVLNLGPLK